MRQITIKHRDLANEQTLNKCTSQGLCCVDIFPYGVDVDGILMPPSPPGLRGTGAEVSAALHRPHPAARTGKGLQWAYEGTKGLHAQARGASGMMRWRGQGETCMHSRRMLRPYDMRLAS